MAYLALPRSKKIALAPLLGAVIFASKVVLPTPIDKAFIFLQALLLSLSSLLLGRMGATYVATLSGLLVTAWRPIFAPFSLVFSVIYGASIDVFLYLLKARAPHGSVRTVRAVLSVALGTLITGAVALYVTVEVGLMPMMPTLYLAITALGAINGAAAGYFASLLWNKHLRHLKL
ncbi:MAG: hypothetical protein N3H31_05935 [Candidatus Nezhaarchaeota archaeon]|nr:hypothetical protein [Candidatus Nezhaarchaeota archaeon]